MFELLKKNNIQAIIDDEDENLSSKIKKFNLIGIPYQIILGKNSESDKIEFREVGKDSDTYSIEKILEILKSKK